jgi:hypothetical protein
MDLLLLTTAAVAAAVLCYWAAAATAIAVTKEGLCSAALALLTCLHSWTAEQQLQVRTVSEGTVLHERNVLVLMQHCLSYRKYCLRGQQMFADQHTECSADNRSASFATTAAAAAALAAAQSLRQNSIHSLLLELLLE